MDVDTICRNLQEKEYELKPIKQKSFYGKAVVKVDSDGKETLYSYSIPIISKDKKGNLTKLYNGWTVTTGKHIKAFCGLTKAEFLEL